MLRLFMLTLLSVLLFTSCKEYADVVVKEATIDSTGKTIKVTPVKSNLEIELQIVSLSDEWAQVQTTGDIMQISASQNELPESREMDIQYYYTGTSSNSSSTLTGRASLHLIQEGKKIN